MRTDKFSGLVPRILGATCALALAASAPIFGATDSASTAGPGDAVAEAWIADPDLAAALSSSSEGLYEEVLPDGSVMVDLQGRFQSVAFATLTESGRVQLSHRSPTGSTSGLDLRVEPRQCRPLAFLAQEGDHATP